MNLKAMCRTISTVAMASLGFTVESEAQTLTLADAIDRALGTHPMVAAANARVLAADELGAAARAARLPTAALTASLTQFQEPMVVAPLHSLNPAAPPTFDRTLVQGQLGARYTLFDFGMRSWRIRGAEAASDGSRAALTSTGMLAIEEVATAFLATVTSRALRDAANARVDALTAERSRAQQHFDAGSAASVDVLRADAALQEARAALASANARVLLGERSLARLTGMQPLEISTRALQEMSVPTADGRGTNEASPFVRQADRALAAAEARVSEEQAAGRPTVVVGAGMQDFGTATGDHALEWRAGVEVMWPLFTGGARGASVRRAAADAAAARAELDAARRRADLEVDAAIAAIAEADARLEALDAAVAQWTEVARIESLALDAGSGEQRDLLQAQVGLFETRAGRASALQEAILARVRLARAEGTLSREWIVASMETR